MNSIDLRLCVALISLIFVLWRLDPAMRLILIIATWIIFVIIYKISNKKYDKEARCKALNRAKLYLAPYKNIWRDLKLRNKYCILQLGTDGVSISAKEKVPPYRKFRVLTSHVHTYVDLWNMFCYRFSHKTTYDGLIELSNRYQLSIYESFPEINEQNQHKPIKQNIEKIDINNCSEIEITALPCINIVMAKKIIKKREEIGGFKTVSDFYLFIKAKPHQQKVLADLICINKMKGLINKIDKNSERKIDL